MKIYDTSYRSWQHRSHPQKVKEKALDLKEQNQQKIWLSAAAFLVVLGAVLLVLAIS